MALNLKMKKKCRIVAPEWLNVGLCPARTHAPMVVAERWTEYLQERLNRETSEAEFSQLPFRFAEISKVLLDG